MSDAVTVRTVQALSAGGAEVYDLVDEPRRVPAAGEVSVRVHAMGVNPADLLFVAGRYFVKPTFPVVPGGEAAGEVDALGPGVDRFAVGDRVTVLPATGIQRGTWSTQVLAAESQLLPTPPILSDSQAGSAWLVYLTAWLALREWTHLPSGGAVLVTAANSAVGLAAADVARHLGARAVGTVRSDLAEQAAASAGYELLVRSDREQVSERVRELVGEVDVVLDCVAGPLGDDCLRVLRPYGTYVLYGVLSGAPLTLRGGLAIGRQPTIKGLWLGRWMQHGPPERVAAAVQAVGERLASGAFTPRVDRTFPLEQVREAVEYCGAPGRAGKVVLTC